MKTLIVSGVRASKGQGHLLSCSGQLKMTRKTVKVCSDKKKPREEIENIKEIEDIE